MVSYVKRCIILKCMDKLVNALVKYFSCNKLYNSLSMQALTLAAALKKELDALKRGPLLHCLQSVGDVDRLSGQALHALQAQLRCDLEAVEQVSHIFRYIPV